MRIPLCCLFIIISVGTLLAQSKVWAGVDWRTVYADHVKSLLAVGEKGSWENVELSSANDPDHHFAPDRANAFLLALCYSRDVEVVDTLIAAGARVDDSGGFSPLIYAAQYNSNPAILEALIATGADVRANVGYAMLARPALTYAAQYNDNPAVIAYLITRGASVNAKVSVLDNMGFTPLMYAAQYNRNPAVIDALIKDGAMVDLSDAMGRTALVFAVQYNPNAHVLEALLAAGASVNIIGRDYYNVGFTPLMYAAVSEYGPLEKIQILLDAGADARVKSKDGGTALDYAAANNLIPKENQVFQRLENATN
jgi:ankyrin repeat protein